MKYLKYKDIDSYFPKELDASLFVCTKDCGRTYLEPSKFVHICHDCKKEMLIAAYAPKYGQTSALITLGIVAGFFIFMNLILFRNKIFKRKKDEESTTSEVKEENIE